MVGGDKGENEKGVVKETCIVYKIYGWLNL